MKLSQDSSSQVCQRLCWDCNKEGDNGERGNLSTLAIEMAVEAHSGPSASQITRAITRYSCIPNILNPFLGVSLEKLHFDENRPNQSGNRISEMPTQI